MRPALKDGRLVEPSSLTYAVKRYGQLAYETDKITKQLADPLRQQVDSWRVRAIHRRAGLLVEQEQLERWLCEHFTGKLGEVLASLEPDDLTPEERELYDHLTRFNQFRPTKE